MKLEYVEPDFTYVEVLTEAGFALSGQEMSPSLDDFEIDDVEW